MSFCKVLGELVQSTAVHVATLPVALLKDFQGADPYGNFAKRRLAVE